MPPTAAPFVAAAATASPIIFPGAAAAGGGGGTPAVVRSRKQPPTVPSQATPSPAQSSTIHNMDTITTAASASSSSSPPPPPNNNNTNSSTTTRSTIPNRRRPLPPGTTTITTTARSKNNKNKTPILLKLNPQSHEQQWIRLIVAAGSAVFVLSVLVLAWHLPSFRRRSHPNHNNNHSHNNHQDRLSLLEPATTTTTTSSSSSTVVWPRPPKANQRPGPYRLALLLPFVADGPEQIPAYLNLFCQGAQAASHVADFFIIHNGVLSSLLEQELSATTSSTTTSSNACQSANNVMFVNLQSTTHMAERLLRVVQVPPNPPNDNKDNQEKENEIERPWKIPKARLQAVLTAHLSVYPYTLVEYKPAYGYIFEELLKQLYYTHWGYTDLDMVFGDLGRHIEEEEWSQYDIVTYGFGDQQRLYVKGQFTMHRNTLASRRTWWQDCPYLSQLDDRWHRALFSSSSSDKDHHNNKNNKFQLESAEGCYSAVLLQRKDISIKYAVKAWTDVSSSDLVYSQGLYLFPYPNNHNHKHYYKNNNQGHHVLVKAVATDQDNSEDDEEEDDEDEEKDFATAGGGGGGGASSKIGSQFAMLDLAPDWFLTDAVYQNRQQPLQVPVGAMESLPLPAVTNSHKKKQDAPHCMFWVQPKYQKYLCLQEPVSANENVYFIKGELFKQAFSNVPLPSLVRAAGSSHNNKDESVVATTGPFFHFQEWKRRYRINQLAVFEDNEINYPVESQNAPMKVLLPEGAIVIPSNDMNKSSKTRRRIYSSNNNKYSLPSSPLGIALEDWKACQPTNTKKAEHKDDRSQLPSRFYCLSGRSIESNQNHFSASHKSKFKMECHYALSWQNRLEIEILSAAPAWNPTLKTARDGRRNKNRRRHHHHRRPPVSMDVDVTLIQTVQIHAAMGSKAGAALLQTVRENLNRWNGQPCVLLFQVSHLIKDTAIPDIKSFVASLDDDDENGDNNEGNGILDMCFIALIASPGPGSTAPDNSHHQPKAAQRFLDEPLEKDPETGAPVQEDWIISEKALQNMAVDVVPTRWYVTGLNLEGGQQIQISPDMVELARQKAMVYQSLEVVDGGGGHVFWIPTFAFSTNPNEHNKKSKKNDDVWNLSHWLFQHQSKNDGDAEEEEDEEDEEKEFSKGHGHGGPPPLFRGGNSMELCNDNPDHTRHDEEESSMDKNHFLANANRLWWEQTLELLPPLDHQQQQAEGRRRDEAQEGRIQELAERLQNLEYELVSHLLKQGSRGGTRNVFQNFPHTMPVLLVDNLYSPPSSSSSSSSSLYYQKTHLLSREVEEFGGSGHEGCFPMLRLVQLILFGYAFHVLEGAFTVDTTPYVHKIDDETENDNDDESTERYRRHRRIVLCAANCVYLDDGLDDLRDQILEYEVVRAMEARALWSAWRGNDDSSAKQ
ncbi:hypothetical protein ACA910_001421 [Epithemia clementina (nom. ined.)]